MATITPTSSNATQAVDFTASSQPTTAAENPGSILDRDAFLKLLVAQLKYQDPTSPTDASAMMAQTSQLTMVERLEDINKALTSAAVTDRLTLAGTMVGRQVTFQSESGPSTAIVDSVRFVNGDFVLSAGGFAVPMEAIIEVGSPPAAVAAPASAPASASAAPAAEGLRQASW